MAKRGGRRKKRRSTKRATVKSMLVISNKGDVKKLTRGQISKIRRLGKKSVK